MSYERKIGMAKDNTTQVENRPSFINRSVRRSKVTTKYQADSIDTMNRIDVETFSEGYFHSDISKTKVHRLSNTFLQSIYNLVSTCTVQGLTTFHVKSLVEMSSENAEGGTRVIGTWPSTTPLFRLAQRRQIFHQDGIQFSHLYSENRKGIEIDKMSRNCSVFETHESDGQKGRWWSAFSCSTDELEVLFGHRNKLMPIHLDHFVRC